MRSARVAIFIDYPAIRFIRNFLEILNKSLAFRIDKQLYLPISRSAHRIGQIHSLSHEWIARGHTKLKSLIPRGPEIIANDVVIRGPRCLPPCSRCIAINDHARLMIWESLL